MVKAEIKDEVYREFWERLVRAAEIHQTGSAGPDEMEAAIVALSTTIDLIKEMPGIEENGLHFPLINLKHSLQDYAAGLNPDILKRGPVPKNRPRHSTKRKVLRAHAASAMDMLMLSGFSRQNAAEFVANKLTNDGWRDLKKGVSSPINWQKVKGWRERANQGDSTELSQDLYRHYKTTLLPQYKLQKGDHAEGMSQATRWLDYLSVKHMPDKRPASANPKEKSE